MSDMTRGLGKPLPKRKKAGREKRSYTRSELTEMAKIFYEVQMRQTATIYAWTPIYTSWKNLTPDERDRAVQGLKERIELEGLVSYLERKRPRVGDAVTNEIISELKRQSYL